jgi:hypothetical protein
MPDYRIVNRRGGKRTVYLLNTDQGAPEWSRGVYGPGRHVGNPVVGALQQVDIDDGHILTVSAPWANMKFYMQGAETVGPYTFPADVDLVITHDGPEADHIFIDLNATRQRVSNELRGAVPAANKMIDDRVEQLAAASAAAVLTGLALSFGMAVPGYNLVAGAAGALAAILSMSFSAKAPPEPPDIQQIRQALTDVVEQKDALEAGVLFASSYKWFASKTQELQSFPSPDEIPGELETAFRNQREAALSPTQSDSFYSKLMQISRAPDVGKYILSEFLMGIGLFLVLKRVDVGATYVPISRKRNSTDKIIPPVVIDDLYNDVVTLRQGFAKARERFVSMRAEIVEKSGLTGIPESIFVLKEVSEKYLGSPYGVQDSWYANAYPTGCQALDQNSNSAWVQGEHGYAGHPDPITNGYQALTDLESMLKDDLTSVKSGGWATNLLGTGWLALNTTPA